MEEYNLNEVTFAVVFLNGMLKKIDARRFEIDSNSNILFFNPYLTNSIASGIWAFVEEYNPETHKELIEAEDKPETTQKSSTVLEMIKGNKDN